MNDAADAADADPDADADAASTPRLRVMKFGGSSLRTGRELDRIARLILAQKGPRVVVVSALQGVTDRLHRAAGEIRESEDNIPGILDELRERHMTVLEECDAGLVEPGEALLAPIFEKLERLFYGIAYTEELTPKTMDLCVSFGERFSARLLALAIEHAGGQSRGLDADAVGIVSDGVYGLATARMEPTRVNVRSSLMPLIEDGLIPIVTGYFGRDEDGHVTTFGRGGSDYSAAVLTQALDAEALEVWKDVDGFLTADPNRIEDARPLAYMTYDEAAELAYLGAKVLHPRTVEPLHDAGINILVKNTMNPNAPGTRIGPPKSEPEHLRAIGVREGFAIVRIQGSGMAYTPGVGRDVFKALGDADINVVNMAASQASFALLVDDADAERARQLILDVRIPTVEHVTIHGGLALVCFVGENIGAHEGVAGRVFSVVGDAGVNVEMISVGASNVALAFVVEDDDAERAMAALHDAFLHDHDDDAVAAKGSEADTEVTPTGTNERTKGSETEGTQERTETTP